MGDDTYLSHLSTLQEIVLDEEKLVTYVSISKEFCIHFNESKSLMYKALEKIRKKHPDTILNVTYILSGLTSDNKAQTIVCPEGELSEYRNGMKLVFFEHIYSINKGKPSVDKVAFMAITTFEDYQLCTGLLKNNACSKLTSDEMSRLKLSSQESMPDQKVAKPPPKQVKEENAKNKFMNSHGDVKIEKSKSEPPVKQEKLSPKKHVSPQKNNVNSNKQKTDLKNSKPQKGIAGFFSRSDSAPVKKVTVESKKNEPVVKIKSEPSKENDEKMDVDVDIDEPKVKKNVDNTVISNGKKTKEKGKSQNSNKSLNQIKKNAKVDKKRKRVLHISDSDSDEEKNDPFVDDEDDLGKNIDVDSEDEIPPTPAVNTIKVASNMLNPRKRRKIVTKTYTDEDGYILTKKEEIYESLSENEDTDMKENVEKGKANNDVSKEPPLVKSDISPTDKKSGPKNSKKKISPPQKGKQATLMSFFKKA